MFSTFMSSFYIYSLTNLLKQVTIYKWTSCASHVHFYIWAHPLFALDTYFCAYLFITLLYLNRFALLFHCCDLYKALIIMKI